ncbi:hypothetical protein CONPUDRAFT_166679 [Coniophora puteana RWD-64-598 SS2]|uniref:Uncharacterized protein n=1 Tax=Coniophora puteana (strain RWD-64-598) TaxID=741705 RepID=A0A5M3MM32_CONPW|nr:uncharacterized protein CONPUDRAFT_166679 [Coniophora puteana RWD-64-598 SS2]EIW80087.1 hypothetical protein CONPUDRAFT_166679 [Coniophora puteana RWD-64-598 SS2]
MPLPTASREGDPVLLQTAVRATRRDVTFWHPGWPLMRLDYWEYIAKGVPSKDHGEWGDVYVDLSDNLLYAKLLRGWTPWPGVTSSQGASHGRMVSWSQLKKKWLIRNPTSVNECLPDHSEDIKYLWCTREGIHWWTRTEIEDDMDKDHDFPPDAKLRTNGRWIVRDFVKSTLQQPASSTKANASQSAGAGLKRTRDDDSRGSTSSGGKAGDQPGAASKSDTSTSANKKQRVEDTSAVNSGSLTSSKGAAKPAKKTTSGLRAAKTRKP